MQHPFKKILKNFLKAASSTAALPNSGLSKSLKRIRRDGPCGRPLGSSVTGAHFGRPQGSSLQKNRKIPVCRAVPNHHTMLSSRVKRSGIEGSWHPISAKMDECVDSSTTASPALRMTGVVVIWQTVR